MKYVVLSILTAGIDPLKNDILELSGIIEDTKNPLPLSKIPTLKLWIDKEFYKGSPMALAKNASILEKIDELRAKSSSKLVPPDEVVTKIMNFLREDFSHNNKFNTIIPVAGKSFATFDRMFLRRLKGFNNLPFSQRVIEPSNFFVDWEKDEMLPSLVECRRRAGLPKIKIIDSLGVAWSVIEVLRATYIKKNQISHVTIKPVSEVIAVH